jgi:hypothetical protein
LLLPQPLVEKQGSQTIQEQDCQVLGFHQSSVLQGSLQWAAESSKEMSKELDNNKEPAGSSTNSGSHKRQRSSESFNSMLAKKLDMFAAALKDDGPKLPSSAEVLDALEDIEGLDEDIQLDLYDILTADARKFESMMALPPERRRRWLLKQLKK